MTVSKLKLCINFKDPYSKCNVIVKEVSSSVFLMGSVNYMKYEFLSIDYGFLYPDSG